MSVKESANNADTIRAAVTLFYERVLGDPELSRWFDGVDLSRLRSHQRAFLLVALGGPDVYAGRTLAEAHAGRGITDAAFDGLVKHLVLALEDLGMAASLIGELRKRVEEARPQIVTAK
ncbi:group 1 truncated hemoglobin [soil metagenome]